MSENFQTVIFLVRHGETDFAYVGDPQVDKERVLTEKGRAQSQKNGEYLKDFAPVVIFSSPLKRTVQTAETIKEAADIETEIITDSDLLEIYDNAHYESMATRLPKLFSKIIEDYAGEQIVCVTHQDVIEGALRAVQATSEESQLPCRMGEMYRLVFAGEKFVQATKITVNH